MNIFVYGTLMRGNSNYEMYLSGSGFIGEAKLKDFELYDLGDYPGIVPAKGGSVKGEVYEIDETAKKSIDELEEEGILYTARNVKARLNEGETLDVLTYVYNLSIENAELVTEEKQPWKNIRSAQFTRFKTDY